MFVLVPIPLPLLMPFEAAEKILRPVLGSEAPTVAQLIAHQIGNRHVDCIVEEFLEFNGYPSLATCRRKVAGKRRTKNSQMRPTVRRAMARPLAQGDPSRN